MGGSSPSPPFNLSEVGKTNYCHSEKEKEIIRDTIRSTNEALQRLEIEKRAISLREKALTSDLGRYHIAIAPIKQLSCDILYCIFELHCQDALPPELPFRSKPPQVTLSHVCFEWRRAMLDFPKFWGNIVISPRRHARYDKAVEIANTWLSRAKNLPCSVEFKFPQCYRYQSEYEPVWWQEWHQNIIKDLISRHKFKRLDAIFADHHLRDLLQLSDEKLSCIEDLCLQYVNSDSDRNIELDFHKLVNLTSFSLLPNPFIPIRLSQNSEIANLMLWHQLRHIRFRVSVPALFCLTVMRHSSATLETCSLVIFEDGSSVPPFSHQEPIQCNRLRNFIVDVASSGAVKVLDPFLLSLRLPNLKSLTLGSREDPAMPIDPRTLITMHNTSYMHLEELVISNTASDIDVHVLLTHFPSLRRLELPTMVKFTVAAMYEVGAGSIGADLENLKIKDAELDIVSLLQMIKTRCSNTGKEDNTRRGKPAPFKSVFLHCDNRDGTAHADIFQLIREIDCLDVDLEVNFAESDESEDEYGDELEYFGAEDIYSESDIIDDTFGFYSY